MQGNHHEGESTNLSGRAVSAPALQGQGEGRSPAGKATLKGLLVAASAAFQEEGLRINTAAPSCLPSNPARADEVQLSQSPRVNKMETVKSGSRGQMGDTGHTC